jgi:hypothetical protein
MLRIPIIMRLISAFSTKFKTFKEYKGHPCESILNASKKEQSIPYLKLLSYNHKTGFKAVA